LNTTNTSAATKLALLIDGDNVSATYMPFIMREAGRIGAIAVRRIYGQFKSGKMKSWLKHIDEFELTAVNVSPLTRGKNATDMKLVIEAMDMLYGRQLDGVCIASSDGDFTPLAVRIRANAVACYGFGMKKAPAGYKAEFDHFFECGGEEKHPAENGRTGTEGSGACRAEGCTEAGRTEADPRPALVRPRRATGCAEATDPDRRDPVGDRRSARIRRLVASGFGQQSGAEGDQGLLAQEARPQHAEASGRLHRRRRIEDDARRYDVRPPARLV
jgi:hypothetical protein